jgi:hypothetical protein
MVDAAAVNTIQECIVRNTPIIVNPLPAITEVLGVDYPMYYNDLSQVPSLISLKNITNTYNYLINMDKTSLNINTFMNTFTQGNIYTNLVAPS